MELTTLKTVSVTATLDVITFYYKNSVLIITLLCNDLSNLRTP